MSLVTLKEILKRANEEKYGVGNFDIFNIEMLKGVMQAAEECNSPVILAYGEGFDSYIDMEGFTALMVDAARKASVPVAIHLDHAREYDTILKAMHYGFTSVMIDSSDAPLKIIRISDTSLLLYMSRVSKIVLADGEDIVAGGAEFRTTKAARQPKLTLVYVDEKLVRYAAG
jgi:fructose/tagatose bisphosphate aldolase